MGDGLIDAYRMNEEHIKQSNSITLINKMPDLGARVYNRLCLIENPQTGEILHTFLEPVVVQDGQYEYNVYFDNDCVCVKILIGEMLYCIVRFD